MDYSLEGIAKKAVLAGLLAVSISGCSEYRTKLQLPGLETEIFKPRIAHKEESKKEETRAEFVDPKLLDYEKKVAAIDENEALNEQQKELLKNFYKDEMKDSNRTYNKLSPTEQKMLNGFQIEYATASTLSKISGKYDWIAKKLDLKDSKTNKKPNLTLADRLAIFLEDFYIPSR